MTISQTFAEQDLDQRICDMLAAWDKYEEGRVDGLSPLDSNFINHQPRYEFTSRKEIGAELDALIALADGQPLTRRRLEGFALYLNELDHPRPHALRSYFTSMTGLVLQYYPNARIAAARATLEDMLDGLDIPFQNAKTQLKEKEAALEDDALGDYIRGRITEDMPTFLQRTGLDVEIKYGIEVVQHKDSWNAWCSGDSTGLFNIRFNGRVLGHKSPSYLMHIAQHELFGHAVMETILMQDIQAGKKACHEGMSTIACFGMVHAEALAEAAGMVVADRQPPYERAWNAYMDYIRMVQNNAILLQADHGRTAADAYMVKHAACDIVETRTRFLDTAADNSPQKRLYMPLYAPVRSTMIGAWKQLGTERFGALMGKLYPDWWDGDALNANLRAAGVQGTDMHISAKHRALTP